MTVKAFGAVAHDKPLEPMSIMRRAVGAQDVQIDIAFCGVCHSDLHQVRAEWAGTVYPCVPGHEIVGRAVALGAHVSGVKVGDLVGVGCIVDSCKECEECGVGLENYCERTPTWTYNGQDAHSGVDAFCCACSLATAAPRNKAKRAEPSRNARR